jgi:FLYWCH zinc finger domain
MATIVPGNRKGGFVLVHDGFRYIRNRSVKIKIHWRCTYKGCGSFLSTDLFDVRDEHAAIHGNFFILFFN